MIEAATRAHSTELSATGHWSCRCEAFYTFCFFAVIRPRSMFFSLHGRSPLEPVTALHCHLEPASEWSHPETPEATGDSVSNLMSPVSKFMSLLSCRCVKVISTCLSTFTTVPSRETLVSGSTRYSRPLISQFTFHNTVCPTLFHLTPNMAITFTHCATSLAQSCVSLAIPVIPSNFIQLEEKVGLLDGSQRVWFMWSGCRQTSVVRSQSTHSEFAKFPTTWSCVRGTVADQARIVFLSA